MADAIDADTRPSPRYASASSKEGDFEMLRYCENVVKSMSFPIHSTEIEPLRTSLVPCTVVEWYERVQKFFQHKHPYLGRLLSTAEV